MLGFVVAQLETFITRFSNLELQKRSLTLGHLNNILKIATRKWICEGWEVRDFGKTYQSANGEIHALENINFTVSKGEFMLYCRT
jgi:hypothetical protein